MCSVSLSSFCCVSVIFSLPVYLLLYFLNAGNVNSPALVASLNLDHTSQLKPVFFFEQYRLLCTKCVYEKLLNLFFHFFHLFHFFHFFYFPRTHRSSYTLCSHFFHFFYLTRNHRHTYTQCSYGSFRKPHRCHPLSTAHTLRTEHRPQLTTRTGAVFQPSKHKQVCCISARYCLHFYDA